MQNDQSCRKGMLSTFYSSINVQENKNCSAARLLYIYIGGHSDIPPPYVCTVDWLRWSIL